MSDLVARVRRSPLFWPVPPSCLVVPAGLILLITWGSTRGSLEWRSLDWTHTSALVGTHTRLTAVVAAAAAALVASRLTRRSLVFAQPWQVRATVGAPARQLALVVGWCLGAYVIGLVPLLTVTALRGAGSPAPLPIIGAVAGFAVLTLLGYVIGAALQNLVAVPTAAGFTFLLTGLPLTSDAWSALLPLVSFTPRLGLHETPALGLYRLGFLLLVAGVLAWTLGKLLGERRFLPTTAHGSALLVVVVAAALPHLNPFSLREYTEGAPEVCRTDEGVRYCVHEGHGESLDQIVRDAEGVFAAYGLPGARPEQVRDQSLATSEKEVPRGRDRGVLWLDIHPGWVPEEAVPRAAADWVVPNLGICHSGGVASLADDAAPEERRAAVLDELRGWVLDEAGVREPGRAPGGGGLFAADADRVRAWIAADHERLAACEADPEDLPWST